jgi:hypothetical protein
MRVLNMAENKKNPLGFPGDRELALLNDLREIAAEKTKSDPNGHIYMALKTWKGVGMRVAINPGFLLARQRASDSGGA